MRNSLLLGEGAYLVGEPYVACVFVLVYIIMAWDILKEKY